MAILGADIGGTNTRIGIFMGEKIVKAFESRTKKTPPYDALASSAKWAQRKGIVIESACIAIAGPVENGKARMRNAPYLLSIEGVRNVLGIEKVSLINDFEAVAFGINVLQPRDVVPLTKAAKREYGLKAVIGAGTGLGKALLRYDEEGKCYIPLPSEEGHAQIAIADEEEFALLEFLKGKTKKKAIVWEDVLSGRGILSLYEFVCEKDPSKAAVKGKVGRAQDKALAIAMGRKKDPGCKEAFGLFARFYARFAKTTALSALPYGGLYIAGGIAAKNPDLLTSSEFKKEWKNTVKCNAILSKIPLIGIKSADLGLRGAAFCAKMM